MKKIIYQAALILPLTLGQPAFAAGWLSTDTSEAATQANDDERDAAIKDLREQQRLLKDALRNLEQHEDDAEDIKVAIKSLELESLRLQRQIKDLQKQEDKSRAHLTKIKYAAAAATGALAAFAAIHAYRHGGKETLEKARDLAIGFASSAAGLASGAVCSAAGVATGAASAAAGAVSSAACSAIGAIGSAATGLATVVGILGNEIVVPCAQAVAKNAASAADMATANMVTGAVATGAATTVAAGSLVVGFGVGKGVEEVTGSEEVGKVVGFGTALSAVGLATATIVSALQQQ